MVPFLGDMSIFGGATGGSTFFKKTLYTSSFQIEDPQVAGLITTPIGESFKEPTPMETDETATVEANAEATAFKGDGRLGITVIIDDKIRKVQDAKWYRIMNVSYIMHVSWGKHLKQQDMIQI